MNIKVKIENQIFEVNVGDLNARPILATVDGQTFEVWPEEMPRMVTAPSPVAAAPIQASTPSAASVPISTPKAPVASPTSGASTVVTAPIPGVIVVVAVKEGETVNKGQELVVLEAMKMKNSIRSNKDAVVVSIKVKVGDHVQHGQALIELKD